MSTAINKNSILNSKIWYLFLFGAILLSLLLSLPVIHNNIEDPNMIVYLGNDEGYFMDLIWRYYSGEKRASYQLDFDYGLELRYLSDLARFIPSKFINFTPGTFVLILRYLHLSAWILSFFALWHLVKRHFGGGWQPALAVVLLAVRPAFAYFSYNLKPEPLILLVMLIGLNYTLNLIETPSRRNLCIAIACASAAFVVKFTGIFLLPAVIAAMYFAQRYRNMRKTTGNNARIFPIIKMSWVFPSLISLMLIILPLIPIFFYVRKSTGITWYGQYGFWGSVMQNRPILHVWAGALFLILLSFILYKAKSFLKARAALRINEIMSYAAIVFIIFMCFALLFGVRWIINPKDFINTCTWLGVYTPHTQSMNMIAGKGVLYSFLHNVIRKIVEFDVVIFFLVLFYLGLEIRYWRRNWKKNLLTLLKRLTLVGFLTPFFAMAFSMVRWEPHHMLPFFVAMSILSIQGFYMFGTLFKGKRWFKTAGLALIGLLFLADIGLNATALIRKRLRYFRQSEDVAYDIRDWWRENIPLNATIVADHHTLVYIPPEYENVKIYKKFEKNWIDQLRDLVDVHQPQFVYYDEKLFTEKPLPTIEEILPARKTILVKSFENTRRRYQRHPDTRFLIYKVVY